MAIYLFTEPVSAVIGFICHNQPSGIIRMRTGIIVLQANESICLLQDLSCRSWIAIVLMRSQFWFIYVFFIFNYKK